MFCTWGIFCAGSMGISSEERKEVGEEVLNEEWTQRRR
jgi:hypothetical protein